MYTNIKIVSHIITFLLLSYNLHGRELRFAIIDGIKIAEQSVAFKNAKSKIDKQLMIYDEYSKTSYQILSTKFNELEKQKSTLSNQEYKKQMSMLKDEIETEHYNFSNKRMEIDKMADILQERIGLYVQEIIKEISIIKKIDIVFEKSSIAYSNDKIEITNYVISKLNKDFIEVDIG